MNTTRIDLDDLRVKSGSYIIELSSNVVYDIACDTYYALKHSCETHWINYEWYAFENNEKIRLGRLQFFLKLSNYPHLYEQWYAEFEKVAKKQ